VVLGCFIPFGGPPQAMEYSLTVGVRKEVRWQFE
jgi:hypothetical protein